jgi:hypothetical protein
MKKSLSQRLVVAGCALFGALASACSVVEDVGSLQQAAVATKGGLPDWDAGWAAIAKWNCDSTGNGPTAGTCLAGWYYDGTKNCQCCVKNPKPTAPAMASNVMMTDCDGTGCKFPSYCTPDGTGGCDVTTTGSNAIWLTSYNASGSCKATTENDLCLLPRTTGCMLVASGIDTTNCTWTDPATAGQSPECGNKTCTGQDAFYCTLAKGTAIHYAPVDVSTCDKTKKCSSKLKPRKVLPVGTARIFAPLLSDAAIVDDDAGAPVQCGDGTCGGCDVNDPSTNPDPQNCDCVPCGLD